ncbi:hypothetical protein ACOQFL_16255 [Actinopolyspora sp. H202]|uniref:hypothetical protein n=1 Tax=Actinopolyspora sp. H202 TaxID=1500456 RepID=UPI003EE77E7C
MSPVVLKFLVSRGANAPTPYINWNKNPLEKILVRVSAHTRKEHQLLETEEYSVAIGRTEKHHVICGKHENSLDNRFIESRCEMNTTLTIGAAERSNT